MPKKLPYFPFYTGDWLKDDALTLCAPATRGVWIDLLARMHERDRSGELCGTADQLARAARCSTVEFVHAATDLQTTGTADVTERNGVWTVRNRRMWAESNSRKANADRQMRHRNASRDGPSNGTKTTFSEDEIETAFESFWSVYPSGRKRSKGIAREAFVKAIAKALPGKIVAAAAEYAKSDSGRGEFVKMPSTWLNQECWDDDRRSWKDVSKQQGQSQGEFRKIPMSEFSKLVKDKQFLTGPYKDKPNEDGFYRVFGQLKNGRKVESHTDPNWSSQ